MSSADPTIDALVQMRHTRRRKRLANIHWVDALFNVYIVALLGTGALVLISGAAGGTVLSRAGLLDLSHRGPEVLGLLPALAIMAGLRSGSRGGPLALEQPDVRHVLMSGVPRSYALRGPVIRQLRSFVFIGIVVGGAAGLFARHRLGTNPIALVACGAGFGLGTVLLGAGCALVAAGQRLPRWFATLIGLAVVAWSIADIAGDVPTAPMTFLGRMPLWPLHMDLLALIPAGIGLLLTVWGIYGIAGLSIEHAERRTKLVGQLRFAVTLQDLRTVLVLRRQLAQELPREQPWFGGGPYKRPPRFLVFSRGVRSIARFPSSRLVRLVILAVIAGFAAHGTLQGTLPLVIVVGLAMWVAGLDAIEPLAQETDHPSRSENFPCDIGELHARHLAAPALVMLLVAILTAGISFVAAPSETALRVAAIAIVPLAFLGLAGAVVSALMGAPSTNDEISAMMPPEFAGMKNVIRAGWPPFLSVVGALPFLIHWAMVNAGKPPWGPTIASAIGGLVVAIITAIWVRYREDIHAWWQLSMDEAKQQRSSRDAQRAKQSPTRTRAADDEVDESDDDFDDEDEDSDDEPYESFEDDDADEYQDVEEDGWEEDGRVEDDADDNFDEENTADEDDEDPT